MNDLVCLGRLDHVLKGACDCVKAEHNHHLDNWRELKESFLQVNKNIITNCFPNLFYGILFQL